jgi:hypothetical protein
MSLRINRFEEKMVSLVYWHRRGAIGNDCSASSPDRRFTLKKWNSRFSEGRNLCCNKTIELGNSKT